MEILETRREKKIIGDITSFQIKIRNTIDCTKWGGKNWARKELFRKKDERRSVKKWTKYRSKPANEANVINLIKTPIRFPGI